MLSRKISLSIIAFVYSILSMPVRRFLLATRIIFWCERKWQ